jgi:phage terminase small subunit
MALRDGAFYLKQRGGLMTPKQTRFVAEYLANGLNVTNAAIAAGYSDKTARQQGSRMLSNPEVAAAVSGKTTFLISFQSRCCSEAV